MRCKVLLIISLCCTLPFNSLTGQGRSVDFVLDRGDVVEDLLLQYYELYRFNGALLVAENDQIIYQNTFGFADFSTMQPLDSETPFYLASLSKQFTATAVMKLVEDEKIDLNDPVTFYFPQLPKFYTEVKVSNLLNHTSGIPDYLNSSITLKNLTNQQVYQYLGGLHKLEFKPGTKYRYSNSGYTLLAMIVEVASGQTIDNYFEQLFFTPLQMTETFVYSEKSAINKRALGYDEKEKLDDYELLTVGDGGFYSTTSDLFIWLKALNSGEIITQASLEAMYKPVKLQSGREKRYGFGWELGNNTSGPLVYHSGQLAGFRTYLERQNSTGTTIIILTNNSFSKIADLRNKLVKILDGRITSISED